MTKEDRFEAFIRSRSQRGDWADYMSPDRTVLVKQRILEECGFPRSTLYQNQKIKARLAEVEARLQRSGTLRNDTISVSNNVLEEPEILSETDALESRLDILQQRISALVSAINDAQTRAMMTNEG